ncbi:MAG: acyltransferase [Ruminococcaceae bacterium]|nr:acyltransferase [Oscillospiraceae bacterium]
MGDITVKSKNRFHEIDYLETIAITFVIFYHCTRYSFDFINSGSVADYLIYFSRTILATCVPIFFFANGYLLLNKDFDLKKHIKKTLRLFVLIFIWAFILMPLYLLIAGESISISAVVVPFLNLSVESDMNLFWYLGALICIYILFPIIKTTFDNNKKSFIFFVSVIALLTLVFDLLNEVVLYSSTFTHSLENGLEMPLTTIFNPFKGSYGYSFVYFGFGGLTYTLRDKIVNIKPYKRNLISIFGIIINCIFLFVMGLLHSKLIKNEVWDIVWNGYDTIFTFLNVLFIYILCLNFKKDFKLVRVISCNTLGIYFTHNLFISLIERYCDSLLSNWGLSVVATILVLLCSLGISFVMRKIPVIRNLV